MKSRIRPPLNLGSSETRNRKSRLRPLFEEDESAAPEASGEDDLDIPASDFSPAAVTSDLSTPYGGTSQTDADRRIESVEPINEPVTEMELMVEDDAPVKPDLLDAPFTVPPSAETGLPPATARAHEPIAATTPATPATVKVTPEGIMKVSGGSSVRFWGGVTVVSLGWALCLTAFVLGAETQISAFTVQPFRMAILGALALFPIGLIVASAFALRHAAALSHEARRTAALADAMIAPASMAAASTTALVESLRQQVEQAVHAVRVAHNDLNELSLKLKFETEAMLSAAEQARQSTHVIAGALSSEREAVIRMGQQLDVQAHAVIEAVDRQARMVADASDLAQTQLREAEAVLASRATDLTAAAADAHTTARAIADDLDRQTLRLETAGAGVADQIRSVEEGLSQQRAGLVSAALSLRADQEDFAVHLENQRGQLSEALSVARTATIELGETSSRGVDMLRELVLHAQDQFRQVLNGAENERTAFETRIHSTLSNISDMAADARDELIGETRRALEQLNIAAEDARRAAADAAQTAQVRVDRLNESLFEAGKKADEAFDARFSAARRLIEDSAALIDDAGEATAQHLDQVFARARDGIRDVESALSELNARADELPLQSKSRLEEIRRAVEDGLLAMTEAARKAALETESVDQAFQDRVKRNYEMLTEAVRLMGVISSQPLPTAPSGPNPYVERFERPRDTGRASRTAIEARAETRGEQPSSARSEPRAERPRRGGVDPLEAPMDSPRPLSPSTGRSGPRASTPDGWSWRDLLNGMEGREAAASPPPTAPAAPAAPSQPQAQAQAQAQAHDNLDDLMIAEVASMGVDAHALLNRSRLEEIIAAIVADDNEGARLVIRRIAPAAIRRLSRRLTTDVTLRDQAQDFVTFYDRQINIALLTRDPRHALGDILSSDTGRTYLLFDAAISDLI